MTSKFHQQHCKSAQLDSKEHYPKLRQMPQLLTNEGKFCNDFKRQIDCIKWQLNDERTLQSLFQSNDVPFSTRKDFGNTNIKYKKKNLKGKYCQRHFHFREVHWDVEEFAADSRGKILFFSFFSGVFQCEMNSQPKCGSQSFFCVNLSIAKNSRQMMNKIFYIL